MSFLHVDYENAIAQAKRLEQAASLCGDSHAKLQKEHKQSEMFWTGESGNAMRLQMVAVIRELNYTKQHIEEAAALIRRVAEELRKKDEEMGSMIRGFGTR